MFCLSLHCSTYLKMASVRQSKRVRIEKPSLSMLQQDLIALSGKHPPLTALKHIIRRMRLATKKDIEDFQNWSPLVRAILMCTRFGSNENIFRDLILELVEVCHAKGVSLDAGDRCVATGEVLERPLVLAAHYGDHQVVEKLLFLGASPDCANGEGKTALHAALHNPVSMKRLRNCDRATFQILVIYSCITTSLGIYRSSPLGSKLYINGDEITFGTPMLRAIRFQNDDALRILVEFGAFLSDRDFLLLYKMKLLRRFRKMIIKCNDSRGVLVDGKEVQSCNVWSEAVDWSFPPTWKVAVHLCSFCGLPEEVFNSHLVPFLPRHWFYNSSQLAGESLPPRILASLGELELRYRDKV